MIGKPSSSGGPESKDGAWRGKKLKKLLSRFIR
jgi:hypothetical protein